MLDHASISTRKYIAVVRHMLGDHISDSQKRDNRQCEAPTPEDQRLAALEVRRGGELGKGSPSPDCGSSGGGHYPREIFEILHAVR